ncbi:MAG: tautomerase family protein [Sporocytophaga sp.]|uniref:tautomerase family protein n=1 Tax=Sporocytophaga sp. TaxID=2231183 RepID=UPI001B215415|nr:tautomerase family protein [Sporocytophaga sp.]MBO9703173.1 tautomerase family protein [Sporocytophaga sp.]
MRQLIESTHSVLVQTLEIPDEDKNLRVIEFDPDLFYSKKPYEIFIQITLFKGRTIETKKVLFQNIVQELNKKLSIDKDSVFIVLNEQPLENWGLRGGQIASDINIGFNINI